MIQILKEIYHYVPFWIWAVLGWCAVYTIFILAVLIAVYVTRKDDDNEDK